MFENVNTSEGSFGRTGRNVGNVENFSLHGRYQVECRDTNGVIKWTDTIDNLVVTVGKNDLLDKYLSGTSYTATWYMGLISATSFTTGLAATDTASSHPGWVEDTGYSNTARPTAAWSAASNGSKSLSSALVFNINTTTTIKGCFLINNATKGGTTGVLFSAGLFANGDKLLSSGDILSVNYTLNT